MGRNEHVVIADSEGYFYCRAVDSVLNYKKDQQVCGCGCPCFVKSEEGRFVCCYEKGETQSETCPFPVVEGLCPALQKAYSYAAKAHRNQRRKGTSIPYLTHIITTMNYALELTEDIEVLQAAILHDTVEDTDVSFEDLKRDFGERVAALVAAETEDKRHGTPACETWEIRKKEAIENLKSQTLDVKMIVLADKTANAESLVREWQHIGDKVWEKFNQTDKRKQAWYFQSIREQLTELDGTEVMQQFDKYIEILFGNKECCLWRNS